MCAEEKEQITDYSEIRDYNVSEKWQSLQWKKLERKDGVTVFPPNSPGLYRLVFKTNSEIKSFPEVCICNKNDAKLKCENIFNGNEIVLSIGKTKKLKTRLTQHFGKYKIASRLKNRCIQFFKNDVNDDISKISLDNLAKKFQNKEPDAENIVLTATEILAEAIAEQMNNYPVDKIVISGDILKLGSRFQKQLQKNISASLFSLSKEYLQFHFPNSDSADALAIGASMLAAENYVANFGNTTA